MKQLELELNKRLIIVEGDMLEFKLNDKRWLNDQLFKICKGSELTEEIAKVLVKSPDNFQFLDAENTFIGEIEKHGYYWGENPIEKPAKNDLNGSFFTMQTNFHQEKAYDEAESKTFTPDQTLIFEIL